MADRSQRTAQQTLRRYRVQYLTILLAGAAVLAAGAYLVAVSPAGVVLVYPLLVALMVVGLLVAQRLAGFRAHAHIGGPPADFLLGSLPTLLADEHERRDQTLMALHRTHGPMLTLHLPWGSAPFVSMSHTSDALTGRDVDSLRRADREVLGDSLMGAKLTPDYRTNRRALNPNFSARGVRGRVGATQLVTDRLVQTWQRGETAQGSIQTDLHYWSANSLCRYLFGEEWDLDQDLSDYLGAIHKLESAISLRTFHPFFVKWTNRTNTRDADDAYRYLSTKLEAMMEARLRRETGLAPEDREADVLGRLASSEGPDGWPRPEAIDELVSMTAGGTDSMSYTSSQTLLLLAAHPEVQNEAHARIQASKESGTEDPYVEQILYETLRLYPPVPFSAKFSPRGPLDADGIVVPERSNLMWMKTAVGRNERYFADPDTFDPSRYEEGRSNGCPRESIQPAMPFGAGPRHCVGRALAETLLTNLLTQIIDTFEIHPIEGVEVTYSATVSVTPSSVPVSVVPRVAVSPSTSVEVG